MRSGLLFTTTEGHFLTRFFLGKKKKRKGKKKLVGKRSNPNPSKRSKGCERSFQDTRTNPYNCVPPPRCNTVVRCESLSRDIRGKAT